MYKTNINFKGGFTKEVVTKEKATVKREDYDYIVFDASGAVKLIVNDDEVSNIEPNVEEIEELDEITATIHFDMEALWEDVQELINENIDKYIEIEF